MKNNREFICKHLILFRSLRLGIYILINHIIIHYIFAVIFVLINMKLYTKHSEFL